MGIIDSLSSKDSIRNKTKSFIEEFVAEKKIAPFDRKTYDRAYGSYTGFGSVSERELSESLRAGFSNMESISKDSVNNIGIASISNLNISNPIDVISQNVVGPVLSEGQGSGDPLYNGAITRSSTIEPNPLRSPSGGNEEDLYNMRVQLQDEFDFYFYVNPEEKTWVFADKVKSPTETIGGVIESNFQDGFDTIQCSGTTGGFFDRELGYVVHLREQSDGYSSFLKLLSIFKMNADTYNNGMVVDSSYVKLFWMGIIWTGKFTSFNYTESDTKPFQFDIDFAFHVYNTYGNL